MYCHLNLKKGTKRKLTGTTRPVWPKTKKALPHQYESTP